MSRHDARQLRKQLEAEGFLVRETGSGHYEVRADGRRVTTFPQTPSDCRWRLNTLANIKRWKRQSAPGMHGESQGLYIPVPKDTHGVESAGRAASLEVQNA